MEQSKAPSDLGLLRLVFLAMPFIGGGEMAPLAKTREAVARLLCPLGLPAS